MYLSPSTKYMYLDPTLPHFLLTRSIPISLLARLSRMHVLLHSVLPSYNWPCSPPRTLSFTHIYFLHRLFTILSLHMTKSFQCISFHPIHTTLHSIYTRSHATSFIHAFIALTLPSCHTSCSSQITHFQSTHSGLLCPSPCPSL